MEDARQLFVNLISARSQMADVSTKPPRPPGESQLEGYPELSFTREWGLSVRKARKERGWSQQALADKARCSQSMINQIEKYKATSSKAVQPIVEALGIDPPSDPFLDELGRRWRDVEMGLRRDNPDAFLALLSAAEAMAKTGKKD
jgi:transcriptional regulator with XRE-family HTH domain